jgi:nitroreductase
MALRKPAETSQPVHELIRDRWSPRAFADRPVPRDVLVSLFEAARWAASCNNSQPWRFIVATREDAAAYETLLRCFNDRNQSWGVTAPVIMVTCADRNLPSGTPSRHNWYDTGAAVAQLTFQASTHGLVLHQAQGILPDKVRETYAVPEDFDICTGIALGYQGEPELLPDDYAKREVLPRERKPLTEIVFTGAFGATSPLVG